MLYAFEVFAPTDIAAPVRVALVVKATGATAVYTRLNGRTGRMVAAYEDVQPDVARMLGLRTVEV